MLKRKAIALCTFVLILCLGTFLPACSDEQAQSEPENPWEDYAPAGLFFYLEDAYEYGMFTHEQLEQIAYNYNNNIRPTEGFSDELDYQMRSDVAYYSYIYNPSFRTQYPEDYSLIYYGCYNDCYTILMDNENSHSYLAGIVDYWEDIGGVQFHHRSYDGDLLIWKRLY